MTDKIGPKGHRADHATQKHGKPTGSQADGQHGEDGRALGNQTLGKRGLGVGKAQETRDH